MRSRPLSAIRSLGWPSWLATLVLVALLCAILAYWAMILLAPRSPVAPQAAAPDSGALPELQVASQLFGLTPGAVSAAAASNIQVIGIVAAGRRGSAILAVDGKPAKPFAVGESLSPSQRLAEVRSNAVVISGAGLPIELPVPEPHSLAVLSSAAGKPPQAAPAGGAAGVAPGAGMPPQSYGSTLVPRGQSAEAAQPLAKPDAAPAALPSTGGPSDAPGSPDAQGIVHGIVPVPQQGPTN